MSTTSKKGAAANKAAAARAEKKPAPRKLTWKGLKLELPPELPDTLLFDITEMEAAGDSGLAAFRMLRSLLGQDQFLQVRNALDRKEIEPLDIADLFEAVLAKYGLTSGE